MEERKINTAEHIKLIKESPEKKRSYVFFGFTIIVIILLVVFAIRPTITTIARINEEIKEKERINNLLEKKIEALSELDKEYSANKEKFDDLELIFPAEENFSLLMANMGAIASRNGFSLGSISFNRYRGNYSPTTRVLIPQTLSLGVRGRQSNIVAFLKELEDWPLYPEIESFSYSQQEDGDGTSSFAITLRIYSVGADKFYD